MLMLESNIVIFKAVSFVIMLPSCPLVKIGLVFTALIYFEWDVMLTFENKHPPFSCVWMSNNKWLRENELCWCVMNISKIVNDYILLWTIPSSYPSVPLLRLLSTYCTATKGGEGFDNISFLHLAAPLIQRGHNAYCTLHWLVGAIFKLCIELHNS